MQEINLNLRADRFLTSVITEEEIKGLCSRSLTSNTQCLHPLH